MRTLLASVLICLVTSSAVAAETLLVFTADFCSACQKFHRDYEADHKIVGNREVVVVDVERDRRMARKFRATKCPTFVIVDGGPVPEHETRRHVGYEGPQALKKWLDGGR